MNNQLEFGVYQQCREFLDFKKKTPHELSERELCEKFADHVATKIRNKSPRTFYESKYDFKRNFSENKKYKNHGGS